MTNEGLKAVNKGSSSGLTGQVAEIYNRLGLAWWVEIKTTSPGCLYYFGPFVTASEAEKARPGYVQDLESEDAKDIEVAIKRMKPKSFTVEEGINDVSEPASKAN